MKIKLLILASLLTLCLNYPLYANLAANPGFENGSNNPWNQNEWPDNWWKWTNGGWSAWKNTAASVGANGNNYVDAGANNSSEFVRWGQNINVTPGSYYTLSVNAATENWGNPNGALLIEWKDSSDSRIGEILRSEIFEGTINTNWTRYNFGGQAPENAAKAAFMLEGACCGTVMYDDVAVVPDADFDNDGWVNFLDFKILADKWQQTDSSLDLSGDNFIDSSDLGLFAQQWLNYYEPAYEGLLLSINSTTQYQQIDGFGASLTDSSAWLLYYAASTQQRADILDELFDAQTGIGLSYLRQPIGTSDFRNRFDYSYDDIPSFVSEDYDLSQFSIADDEVYIIPVLLETLLVNPQIKIMGSPWSAPKWMKTTRQIGSGNLIDDDRVYNALAEYFVKYIQAYAAFGIEIDAVTLQNEPKLEPGDYPGMKMTAADQKRLVKLMGPKFDANNIDTKIVTYDHNWDDTIFPISVLSDSTARSYINGTAFHGYSGNVSAQSTVRNAYPDKQIYYTEWSDGEWNDYGFAGNLIDNAETIVNVVRNWSKTFVKWNLVLDENNGPKIAGGCGTCYGVITLNQGTGEITRNPQYYSLGHFSKFVQPDAHRIWSTESVGSGIKNVAFLNPDQTITCLAVNSNGSSHNVKISHNGQYFIYALPADSITTFIWPNQTSASVDVWITTGSKTKLLQQQPAVQFHN